MDFVVTLSCPDKPGLVLSVSGWLVSNDCNILDSDQFRDEISNTFFMRVHFEGSVDPDQLDQSFEAVAKENGMVWQIWCCSDKPRVLIMVSKQDHCLTDLLYRTRKGELPIDIELICSNQQVAIVSLVLLLVSCSQTTETNPLVRHLTAGSILGTETSRGAYLWAGIPYAAAPVGQRRWRAPAPAPHWSGLRDARSFGPISAQPSYQDDRIESGSEDCLFLNVFTPALSQTALERTALRPVMVYIHGGGNLSGSVHEFSGESIATVHDMVVVSINYRLSAFGYFHHPAITESMAIGGKAGHGHFGILDMIAALDWMGANINKFGGDSKNITITGGSSGAQNVVALMMTPLAKGKFHKAVAHSGGLWNMTMSQATNYVDDPVPGTPASSNEVITTLMTNTGVADSRDQAKALLASFGNAELLNWLQSLPSETLTNFYANISNIGYELPNIVFDDVVFAEAAEQWIFSDPVHYNDVPLMLGSNTDENTYFTFWNRELIQEQDGIYSAEDPERYRSLNRYYNLWWTESAVNKVARLITQHDNAGLYAYRFDWDDHDQSRGDLPEWSKWQRGEPGKMRFDVTGDSAISEMFQDPVDFPGLLDELANDSNLTATEKCSMHRDITMYPSYDLEGLMALGCE